MQGEATDLTDIGDVAFVEKMVAEKEVDKHDSGKAKGAAIVFDVPKYNPLHKMFATTSLLCFIHLFVSCGRMSCRHPKRIKVASMN